LAKKIEYTFLWGNGYKYSSLSIAKRVWLYLLTLDTGHYLNSKPFYPEIETMNLNYFVFYFEQKSDDLPSWQSLQEIFHHSSLLYATQRFWFYNCIWYKNDITWRWSIHLQGITRDIKARNIIKSWFSKNTRWKQQQNEYRPDVYPNSAIHSNCYLKW
jgi:hypothetical protein